MAKRRAARRSDAEGESSPRLDTHAASAEPELLDESGRAEAGDGPSITDEIDLEVELAIVGPMGDRARVRRLERACGVELDRCPVLGIELDPSPRAHASHRPTLVEGAWMSARAAEILASRPTVAELEHVVEWLRDCAREHDQEEP